MGTFVGRCREADNALAWLPLIEVLEQLVEELSDQELRDLLGGAGPEVARVLPAFAGASPICRRPSSSPPSRTGSSCTPASGTSCCASARPGLRCWCWRTSTGPTPPP